MSNLRQAAQDVLELVEWIKDNLDVVRAGGDMGISPFLIDKLRADLAEPERKPLTDEEIINIGKEARAVAGPHILPVSFARAIERAHGIGEGQ